MSANPANLPGFPQILNNVSILLLLILIFVTALLLLRFTPVGRHQLLVCLDEVDRNVILVVELVPFDVARGGGPGRDTHPLFVVQFTGYPV